MKDNIHTTVLLKKLCADLTEKELKQFIAFASALEIRQIAGVH